MTERSRERTVLLARHARTEWNLAGRYLGRSDICLDATGIEQARELGAWAARRGVRAVYTSPARRAATTAHIIAAAVGVVPEVDARLRELDFGFAEGRTLAELREAEPEVVAAFEAAPATNAFPGGEPPAEACRRFADAVRAAVDTTADPILVVSHSTVMRLYFCEILGVPLDDYRRRLPVLEHGSHTELSHTDGSVALRRFNAPAVSSVYRDAIELDPDPEARSPQ